MSYKFINIICFIFLLLHQSNKAVAQLMLVSPSAVVEIGDTFSVPIKLVNFDTLASFQFSIGWDKNIIEYLNTEDHYFPNLVATSFNKSKIGEGKLGFLWTAPLGQKESFPDNTVIFSLKCRAIRTGNSPVAFIESPLFIEASYVGGAVLGPDKFTLSTGTISVSNQSTSIKIVEQINGLLLYQNEPNPCSGQTTIRFHLPLPSEAQLSVYDVLGRLVLRSDRMMFPMGENTFSLQAEQFAASGLYFYALETPKNRLVSNMIIK